MLYIIVNLNILICIKNNEQMGKKKTIVCYGCYQDLFDLKMHIIECQFIRKKVIRKRTSLCFPNDQKLCLFCYSYSQKQVFNEQHSSCIKRLIKINHIQGQKFKKKQKLTNYPPNRQLRKKQKLKYTQLKKQIPSIMSATNSIKKKHIKKPLKSRIIVKVNKLQQEFQTPKINDSLSNILAPIYLVCDQNLNIIASKNEHAEVKIASLTKLFNLMTCLQICRRFSISLNTVFQVPELSIRRTQTNAGLRQGDQLTLNDMIYAMLLPSGGDAAESIAVVLGRYLVKKTNVHKQKQAYIKKMNEMFADNANHTRFVDEKGYGQNFSTAQQIVKILKKIGEDEQAYNFLKVYRHRTTVVSKFNIKKLFVWNSTNILIHNGYYGKTGTTTGYKFAYAGIRQQNGKKYYFCVLEHLSHSGRFTDVKQLFQKFVKNKNN